MTVHFQPRLDFEAVARASVDGDALLLELDGWEGPLDVLLELARRQKVDLRALSITALAEQFLAFVQAARRRRFALAADYLVMAAWLAFLKSRLLLPQAERPADDEAPAEEVAEALAFRLAKLAAMREGAEALRRSDQVGRDVFLRGDPEALTVHGAVRLEGSLHELVAAYVGGRRREAARSYAPERRVEAYPLDAARLRLRRLLPQLADWAPLAAVVPAPEAAGAAGGEGPNAASRLASTLAAGLEMTRDGALELRQVEAFAAVHLRARPAAPPPA